MNEEERSNMVKDLLDKGTIMYNSEKFLDAMGFFEKVLEIDPNHILALVSKGKTLLKLEKYRDALIYFRKALEIDPEFEEAKKYRDIALKEIYTPYESEFSCRENIYL
ncbi:MAG: tetratricopeptide repeat protein [Candidatus Hydrothermarchaeota archaeon]